MSDEEPPIAGFIKNTGTMPGRARGKRVRVILAHGEEPRYDDNPMSPPGWAADGTGKCRWTLTGAPFDIIWYKVIGKEPT